jgi:hypothetical protein
MSGLAELLRSLFLGTPPAKARNAREPRRPVPAPPAPHIRQPAVLVRANTPPAVVRSVGQVMPRSAAPSVTVLSDPRARPAIPYWRLRGWRQVKSNLYLGYFKTRLGRRHGVIKWTSQYDFGFYVHDVPGAILNGPHGACFAEVKPGKFRVHFAQLPSDLNSGIFYIETLLMEAFEHGQTA